jgi:DNA repair protein RadD
MDELRDYQREAIAATQRKWLEGKRSVCLVAPTGAGKTVISEQFCANELANNGRVLFVVHRRELVRQTVSRFRDRFGRLEVGGIAPGFDLEPYAPVQVGTIQTMVEKLDDLPSDISLLIADEVHHYAADQCGSILGHYSKIRTLGLTATPERIDGRPLGDILDDLVVATSYSRLLADGHLVHCKVYQPPDILGSDLAQDPVAAYQRYAPDTRAFCFCGSIEQAIELAERFREAGIPAAESTHITPYLQMVGRVLRPHLSKQYAILIDLSGASLVHGLPTEDREYSLEGKGIRRTALEPLKVCPQCGATISASFSACPECGWAFTADKRVGPKVYDIALREIYAGSATPDEAKQREYKRLRELGRARGWDLQFIIKEYRKLFNEPKFIDDATDEEKKEQLAKFRAFAEARGYKPGYAAVRYKELFGVYPR